MYNEVKNTNTYACNNPSNKSKYTEKIAGIIGGHTILSNSIITNAPSTLPKSRIQSDNGWIPISSMLIGVTITTGLVNDLTQPKTPWARIPDNWIRTTLIKAKLAVTLISFVGGVKPKNPIVLENNRKIKTDPRYGI